MTEVVGDELPLLGESLALDAVNSWYGVEPDVVDFLDDPWIGSWVDGVVALHGLASYRADPREDARLRAVRDAVWTVVHAVIERTAPPASALDVVNDAARRVPTVVELAWTPTGPVRAVSPARAAHVPLAGRVAVSAIELLTGPDAPRLRPCANPGCSMVFVQGHGHRRFCHPSCSHATRQDRYRHRRPRSSR